MTTALPDRLTKLPELSLDRRRHADFESGHCAMELVSWLADEPFSDHPSCASPVIGAFVRSLNDNLPDDLRQELRPYLPRLIGTADGHDEARGRMAADYAIRTATPLWLDLAGAKESAEALRSLPPIDKDSIEEARILTSETRDQAREARAQARTRFTERFKAEMRKRGVKAYAATAAATTAATTAAAAADAAADVAADAYAATAAAAAADAATDAADSAADAAADAATDSAADAAAYAATAAAYAATAASYAATAAAYAAATAPSSKPYSAVKKVLRKRFDEEFAPVHKAALPGALELLERMIEVGAEA